MEATPVRSPLIIAAEINFYKEQTRKITLLNCIEIGGRLREAKRLIPHGEWGNWLEESVSYSQSTADKLILLFDQYGPKPLASPADQAAGAWAENLPDLSYTQALILIGIPEEERADFIAGLEIDSLSTRELQKAVDQWKQACAERDQAREENAGLKQTVADQAGEITRLAKSNQALKETAREAAKVVEKVKKTASYNEVVRMSKKLDDVYSKAVANEVAFLYEGIDKSLRLFLGKMEILAGLEPALHLEFKKKITLLLFISMKQGFFSEKREEVEDLIINMGEL